jgi:hypothetical protein
MGDADNNRERHDGAGRRIAVIALSLGALTAPAITAGASDLGAIRAQFAASFTPGSTDAGLAREGNPGLINDR